MIADLWFANVGKVIESVEPAGSKALDVAIDVPNEEAVIAVIEGVAKAIEHGRLPRRRGLQRLDGPVGAGHARLVVALRSHRVGVFDGFAELHNKTPNAMSYYEASELKENLQRFADVDRINDGPIRLSVGRVDLTARVAQ